MIVRGFATDTTISSPSLSSTTFVKTGTESNGIDLYSLMFGDSTGDKTFKFSCPNDQVVTGLNVNSGTIVDSISGITCARPGDLFNTNRTQISGITTGGTPSSLICPAGSAVGVLSGSWNTGTPLQGLKASCVNTTGNIVKSQTWGTTTGMTKNVSSPLSSTFVSGFDGSYGNYIDKINTTFKDIKAGLAVHNTDLGKRKACNAELPSDFSTMTQAQCDVFMGQSCANNTEPRCSCYNSKIIKNFQAQDPMFPNCPHIYDPVCQANGYKSTALKNITECSYLNCPINVINSNITSSNIKNVCSTQQQNTTNETNPPFALSQSNIIFLIVLFLLIGAYKITEPHLKREPNSRLV